MKGLNFRYIYFFSDLKGNLKKKKKIMRCVSFLNAGPVQKPTAVLFNTDEGSIFFFSRKNNNNNKKRF